MTILNCTVSKNVAVMCQDTYGTEYGNFAGFTQKMWTIPHRRMVIGSSGSMYLAKMWVSMWAANSLPAEIGEINDIAPDLLRELWAAAPAGPKSLGLVIAHIGYDTAANRCLGYAYDCRRNFEPLQIDEKTGHFLQPGQLDDSDITHQVVMNRNGAALRGDGMEVFHQHLALNQYRGWERGLFQIGTGIGGELQCAQVDANGVSIRTIAKLPNYYDLQTPGNRGLSIGHLVSMETNGRNLEWWASCEADLEPVDQVVD